MGTGGLRRWVAASFGLVTWLACNAVAAEPPVEASARSEPSAGDLPALREDQLPQSLRPWVPWVLSEVPDHGCPRLPGGGRRCVWPGALRLEVTDEGGRFEQQVVLDAERTVSLPGDAAHFPLEVTVDGTRTPVAEAAPSEARRPRLHLPAGVHRIEGRFRWRRMPDLLPVPRSVALVELVVDATTVSRPKRDEEGRLWLRTPQSAATGAGHVELEVHRRLEDGLPFRAVTRIVVRASGEPREVALGSVSLDGLTPVDIESKLAARIEPSGAVVGQVRAGTFEVTVTSLTNRPPDALSPPAQPSPWPPSETWVWVPAEALRQVELSGAPSIDPAQTGLPASWREHRAYVVTPERALRFETVRRGEPTPPPNQIEVARELWLDLDGRGYTVRDQLAGTLTHGFRLSLTEGDLGHVQANGDARLITRHDGAPGVELRRAEVDVVAESRLADPGSDVAAVGWSEDAQSLSAMLHVPPGWSLLAATGVDEATGAWLERWSLWGLLFVLLVAVAVGRLAGVLAGLLALVTLALAYHEPGAPQWSWVALVVLVALVRAVPPGRFAKAVRLAYWVSLVVLALVAVPFAASQFSAALYPFTEETVGASMTPGLTLGTERKMEPASMAEPLEALEEDVADELRRSVSSGAGGYGKGGERGPSPSQAAEPRDWVDPDAVIQTGPGVPDWDFRAFRLRWNGPVASDHRMGLWLVPPWATRSLAVIRVVFLLALALVLVRGGSGGGGRTARSGGASSSGGGPSKDRRFARAAAAGSTVTLLVLALAASMTPAVARAQAGPSDARLEALRERLTRPPACAPDCVVASQMAVRLADDRLRIEAEVEVTADSGWRLPGPAERWAPAVVRVDGDRSTALALDAGGFFALRLAPGVHRVELEGPVASDTLTLAFEEPPRELSVEAEGWTVEGVRDDGQVSRTIQLTRVLDSDERPAEARDLPAWLAVRRTLQIGARWTVQTEVERITPTGRPVVTRIPMVPGASVTTEGVLTDGREVVVSLGRDERELSWSSVLEPTASLTLEAAAEARRSERWTLACSPIWRCETEGLAPVRRVEEGHWQPVFRPWPGEAVTLSFARPDAVEGRSTTVDAAKLVWTPGVRMLRARLEATIRTSSGGVQILSLPDEARVQQLTVDGDTRPVQREDHELRISLRPGSQRVAVQWQQPQGLAPRFHAPRVTSDRKPSTPGCTSSCRRADGSCGVRDRRGAWRSSFGPTCSSCSCSRCCSAAGAGPRAAFCRGRCSGSA